MWIYGGAPGDRRGRVGRLAGLLLVLTGLLVVVPEGSTAAIGWAHGCGTARKAGRHVLTVPMKGKTYRVATFLPTGYSSRNRLPLVLNLHGSSHNGLEQEKLSMLEPVADQHHFIVAAPNGGIRFERGYAWNIPGTRLADGSVPARNARNDIAFLAATVRAAATAYCVSTRRVYVTGHSGGARMASTLTCERADQVAALAAVSGLRAGRPDPDNPSRPVPVLSFHGTADELNPYHGAGGSYWGYSVPTAVRAWSRLNGCTMHVRLLAVRAHVLLRSSSKCAQSAELRSYVVTGAGHTWPGSPYNEPVRVAGVTNHEINATRTIWSFFAKHSLPAR